METLSYEFKNISFSNLTKAIFRKYLDEEYKGKTLVTEIDRRLINPDVLEIYRVQLVETFFYTFYVMEKIIIDRKNKMYQSFIKTTMYSEECNYKEVLGGVFYMQKYKILINWLSKSDKLKSFNLGCSVLEKIIDSNNLRI